MLFRVGKKYRVGRRLGSGAFGEIYQGTDVFTSEEVAIKVESIRAEHPQLRHEYKVYRLLNGVDGVPMARYYGTEGDYNVLVMDILGKSLEALFEECGRKFTLCTVLCIADQLISRIQTIHSKSLIHRDIKPDNFLIGRSQQGSSKVVFAVDFGLSKLYMDPKSNRHISYKEGKNLIGTVRYASLYTHMGIEQSRRDDLESIGYVLMYFLRGSLPWQGLQAATKAQKYERVFLKKKSTTIETLCTGHPIEFNKYFKYVKSLKFCDQPNYDYMRGLFQSLHKSMKFSRTTYDWELLAAGSRVSAGVSSQRGVTKKSRADGGEDIENANAVGFVVSNTAQTLHPLPPPPPLAQPLQQLLPPSVMIGSNPPAIVHSSHLNLPNNSNNSLPTPAPIVSTVAVAPSPARLLAAPLIDSPEILGIKRKSDEIEIQNNSASTTKKSPDREALYPPSKKVLRKPISGLNFDPELIQNPTPRQVKYACKWNKWIDNHVCHPIRSHPMFARDKQVQRVCSFCHLGTSYYCTSCPPHNGMLSFVCMKPKCYVEHVLTARKKSTIWVPEHEFQRVEQDSVDIDFLGNLVHPRLQAASV